MQGLQKMSSRCDSALNCRTRSHEASQPPRPCNTLRVSVARLQLCRVHQSSSCCEVRSLHSLANSDTGNVPDNATASCIRSVLGFSLNTSSVAVVFATNSRPSSSLSVLGFFDFGCTGGFAVLVSSSCVFLHIWRCLCHLCHKAHQHQPFLSRFLCQLSLWAQSELALRETHCSTTLLNDVLIEVCLSRSRCWPCMHRHVLISCIPRPTLSGGELLGIHTPPTQTRRNPFSSQVRSQKVDSTLDVSSLPGASTTNS